MKSGLLLPGRRYLLREEFGGSEIQTGRWVVMDSEGKLSVAGGVLSCAGGKAVPAWGDPKLVARGALINQGATRKAGLTLEWKCTPSIGAKHGIGFADAAGDNDPRADVPAAFYFDGDLNLRIADNGAQAGNGFVGLANGTSYRFRIALKDPGALYYYSTDPPQADMTWKLLWESSVNSASPLYPWISENTVAFTIDYIRLFQGIARPPIISDDFSAWSGWTEVVGDWDVAGGQAYSVSNANGDLAMRDAGVTDGILDCHCLGTYGTGGGASYSEPDLIFRYADSGNFLFVELWDGTVYLRKKDGGAVSNLASAAQTTTNGTTYAIRVLMLGNVIKVYVDGVEKIVHTLAGGDTKYAAYTGYGMFLLRGGAPGADARWDNFRVQAG